MRAIIKSIAPDVPFLAPVYILILSVIVIPSLYVAWLSLNASTFGQTPTFVGFDNYVRVLTDPAFLRGLGNTVLIVVFAVHLELAIGLGMALLFATGLPFRRLLLVVVLAPYAVSEVIAVAMWRFLFDPDVGPITVALATLGLPALDWSFEPSHALAVIGLLTIWLHLPFTFVILYAARLAIPKDLYEAAFIDGASNFAAFRRVTIPLLGPAIAVALLFRYIFAFRIFSEVWLMTQGGPARSTGSGCRLSVSGGLSVQRFRHGCGHGLDHGRCVSHPCRGLRAPSSQAGRGPCALTNSR